MTRALWLLLHLRLTGWIRRTTRNAASPRGAFALLFGVIFCLTILGMHYGLRFTPGRREFHAEHLETTRRLGSLILFFQCLFTLFQGGADQGLNFTTAEVQFLFPGPFTRRQLLTYKLVGTGLLTVVYALFLTGFLLPHTAGPVTTFLGLVLTLWFVLLLGTAVSMLVQSLGVRVDSYRRRGGVLALGALLIAGALYASRQSLGDTTLDLGVLSLPGALMDWAQGNQILQTAMTPTRWFAETFTAERLWPDFLIGALRCLGILCGLILLIFLLDADYFEGAAASSERAYARLQRIRGGGASATLAPGSARWSLPMFPRWHGAGPLAWRQMLVGMRSLRSVLVFLSLFVALALVPRFLLPGPMENQDAAAWMIASGLLGMSMAMLPSMLTFDFRGDVDRIEVLKTLPLTPTAIVLGQLLTPVLFLSVIQMGLIGLVELVWGGVTPLLLGTVLFSFPINFISLSVENLLFLWFPARLVPGAPGDFQMMGRQTLLMLAKFLIVGLFVSPALLLAGLVYGIAQILHQDPQIPALVVLWLTLTFCSSGLIPLLTRGFLAFDVARDTPP